jgi:hypothetical protein
MAEFKKSFVAYSDWNGMFNALPDEVAGKLIKHIFSYVNDENPTSDDYVINALFEPIKCTLKRDLQKWDKQREQRSDAGKKSAEVRSTKSNERSTVVNEKERNSTVSVNVSVSDSVNVNDNIIKENNIEERKLKFASTLEPFLQTYGRDLLKDFYNYWTEPNKLNNKLRFESEKFWDLNRRLTTWKGKEKNFAQKKEKPTMRTTNEVFDNVIERIRNGEDTTVKIIGL